MVPSPMYAKRGYDFLMKDVKKAGKEKRIKKPVPKHVVVFQDQDGFVLKTSFIPDGQDATPPEVPEPPAQEEGYQTVFDGWDHDIHSISSNLVLRPVWRKEPKKYLVMYFHENGAMLGMEPVAYGQAATAPYHPEKDSDDQYDYPFIGWSCDLSSVKADTNARAIFGKVRRIFTVRFYHEDGRLLREEKVHFDEKAHPPAHVYKPSDRTYHYVFAGWTYPTDHIRESLNIHAIFDAVYNEYTITFWEEDRKHSSRILHYGDPVSYPALRRKGYDLIWDKKIERVDGNQEIHASWHFSNPPGRRVRTEKGIFQILNPSIHKGTVACLEYASQGQKKIMLPAEVLIGDYYYRIVEIGPYAFGQCKDMKTLVLPDSVRKVGSRGFAGCRKLEKVVLGKKVSALGREIFAESPKIKIVELAGKDFSILDQKAMESAPKRLKIKKRRSF